MKMVIISGELRKKIPPYITKKPMKINDKAKVRILFILLEYLAIFLPPRQTITYLYLGKKCYVKNVEICLKGKKEIYYHCRTYSYRENWRNE
jgi:hypothetical protein